MNNAHEQQSTGNSTKNVNQNPQSDAQNPTPTLNKSGAISEPKLKPQASSGQGAPKDEVKSPVTNFPTKEAVQGAQPGKATKRPDHTAPGSVNIKSEPR